MMDYEDFKKAFYHQSKINLDLYKEKQMKRRITSLVEKNGFSNYMTFYWAMLRDKDLYDTFINYLTINVSEFYRNPSQWKLMENTIIPMLIKRKGKAENIRIWSSACSTGDEPYTIVMLLNKFMPLSKINIIATDIDTGAIHKAEQGIYPDRSVKDLPKEFLDKHFTCISENLYKVSDEVKKCVDFRKLNLLEDKYPQGMDLIVCRNVLIYFTDEAKNHIYGNFNRSLVQDGILFLGSTEQIIGSTRFGFKAIQTFFYQKTSPA
ncbi:MAG: protein-glutamate O-methyltransferase CheR [Thermoclostridium sp.]|nr:protein-glutamate O-methyltransferase CheR [Thermoclostridium sp.]